MEQKPKLDDYILFLAIADTGGLSGAEKLTGVPSPTLSRRMGALERNLSTRLFERGARGYTLTAEGRALAKEAESLRAAAQMLDRFSERPTCSSVRITAGPWTARFIALNIAKYRAKDATWMPELLASVAMVDIARREADIGIRNQRPTQSWLAGRRLSTIRYAEFAANSKVTGYVTLPERMAISRSQRWLRDTKADQIVTTASDTRAEADLAAGGVGRVILPLFAGRSLPGLQQVSAPIDALEHDEWLVSHHDARHDPPVRAAIDALTKMLTDAARSPRA